MRQYWAAQWVSPDGSLNCYKYFLSLDKEVIARRSFELILKQKNEPVPEEYTLRRIGDPFQVRVRRDRP